MAVHSHREMCLSHLARRERKRERERETEREREREETDRDRQTERRESCSISNIWARLSSSSSNPNIHCLFKIRSLARGEEYLVTINLYASYLRQNEIMKLLAYLILNWIYKQKSNVNITREDYNGIKVCNNLVKWN